MKPYSSASFFTYFHSFHMYRVGIVFGWLLIGLLAVTGTGHARASGQAVGSPTNLHHTFTAVRQAVALQKELGFSPEQIDRGFFEQFCQTYQVTGSFEQRVQAIEHVVAAFPPPQSRQLKATPVLPLPDEAYQAFPETAVTTTASSGPGSLREALDQTNQSGGRRRIVFRLSQSDPNFDPARGVWRINVTRRLYILTSQVLVDGSSQQAFGGNTNPKGPEVELFEAFDGTSDQFASDHPFTVTYTLVFIYEGSQNWIRGLSFLTKPSPPLGGSAIQSGGIGISCMASRQEDVRASGNRVSDNFIGMSSDGQSFSGNNMLLGVNLNERTCNTLVENNVIGTPGPAILLDGSGEPGNNVDNLIRKNFLGTTSDGQSRLPIETRLSGTGAPWAQISFFMYPENVFIEENILAGTRGGGIGRPDHTGNRNAGKIIVRNNYIGTNPQGDRLTPPIDPQSVFNRETDTGAFAVGVYVNQNDILTNNVIANFGLGGVFLFNWNGGGGVRSEGTLIEANRISNSPLGIQVCGVSKAPITLVNNTLENCSKGGIVICRRYFDLTAVYLEPNDNFFLTKNITVTQNRFVAIDGPGIGLVNDVREVLDSTYTPNTQSGTTPDGPNLFQPSPRIESAAYQADGTIKVTGTASTSGQLEVYISERPGQPQTDTTYRAYGFGRYLTSFQVPVGSFEVRLPGSILPSGSAVGFLTATLTTIGQTSEFARTVAVTPFENPPDPDRTPPEVTVLQPKTTPGVELVFSSSPTTSVLVQWTGSDNVGIRQYSLVVTGVRQGTAFTESVATGLAASVNQFQVTLVPNDQFDQGQFTVIAADQAGNTGRGVSDFFRVVTPVPEDTEPPRISQVSYSKNKIRRGRDLELTLFWDATDNQAIANQDLWFVESGTPRFPIVTGLPTQDRTFRWVLPSGLNKTKTAQIEVRVRDQAGNQSALAGPLLKIK